MIDRTSCALRFVCRMTRYVRERITTLPVSEYVPNSNTRTWPDPTRQTKSADLSAETLVFDKVWSGPPSGICTQGTEIGQWFTKRPVLETGTFAGNLSLYVAKLRLPRAVMSLTRLPVVGAKVAFFSWVHSEK